jgi:chemotaxis protein methyltransferase CheR
MTWQLDRGPSLSPDEFRLLRDLLYEHCGILFREEMSYLMERRLRARLTALDLRTFESYHRHLRYHVNRRAELEAAVEALTTNETYFFREPNQLRAFSEEVLPELAMRNAANQRLRIWSAGCSTGEECYTLAILIQQSGLFRGWEVEVFGSDISRKVLSAARMAEYSPSALRATSDELKRTYFKLVDGRFSPRADVRSWVSFGHLNLLDGEILTGLPLVDVVFCRNVMIYFDQAARQRVLKTIYGRLVPGGFLFLGHSESLINTTADFELVHLKHDVAYRKPMGMEPGEGVS